MGSGEGWETGRFRGRCWRVGHWLAWSLASSGPRGDFVQIGSEPQVGEGCWWIGGLRLAGPLLLRLGLNSMKC